MMNKITAEQFATLVEALTGVLGDEDEAYETAQTMTYNKEIEMNLAYSLDGCLRISEVGKYGIVELRSHLYPGRWLRCLSAMTVVEAWEFFMSQAKFHSDPTKYFQPVVEPGV